MRMPGSRASPPLPSEPCRRLASREARSRGSSAILPSHPPRWVRGGLAGCNTSRRESWMLPSFSLPRQRRGGGKGQVQGEYIARCVSLRFLLCLGDKSTKMRSKSATKRERKWRFDLVYHSFYLITIIISDLCGAKIIQKHNHFIGRILFFYLCIRKLAHVPLFYCEKSQWSFSQCGMFTPMGRINLCRNCTGYQYSRWLGQWGLYLLISANCSSLIALIFFLLCTFASVIQLCTSKSFKEIYSLWCFTR